MKEGVLNYSRRQADFVNHMSSLSREDHVKRFIASCNPEQLLPFIKIVSHDKNWREIKYVIEVPDTSQ